MLFGYMLKPVPVPPRPPQWPGFQRADIQLLPALTGIPPLCWLQTTGAPHQPRHIYTRERRKSDLASVFLFPLRASLPASYLTSETGILFFEPKQFFSPSPTSPSKACLMCTLTPTPAHVQSTSPPSSILLKLPLSGHQ